MRRFVRIFLVALTALMAFANHAESRAKKFNEIDDPLPANAIARIGTARYHVPHYRQALLLSPDGKRLAVNNSVDGIDVWQLPAWKRERTIRIDSIDPDTEARFAGLAFTPDSKNLLIFNASTEQLVVIDLAAGKVARRIAMPVDGPFYNPLIVAANDQKALVLSWSDAGTPKQAFLAFDLDKGQVRHSRKLLIEWPLKKLIFSPDGNTVLALDEKGVVRHFDLKNDNRPPTVRNWGGQPLAFSRDARSIFVRKANDTLVQCDAFYHTILTKYASPMPYAIDQVGLPSDGKTLALGISRNTVFLWDAATGKLLSPTDVPSGAIRQLTFSAKGELFVAAENGHAAWWNPRRAVKLRDVSRNDPRPPDAGAWQTQTAPDGIWRAVNEKNERILISRADGRGGRAPVAVRIPGREITSFAFSSDSRQLACAAVDPFKGPVDGRIFIYEMSSKKIRLALPGHAAGVIERLAYAPDPDLLASAATDGQVLVWQAGLRAHVQAPSSRKPTAKDLNEWYSTMAGTDAVAAFQSMIKLAEAPASAANLLADKIPPAPKLDTGGRTMAQWIGDLGSGNFSARTKANAALLRLGASAEPDLRAALKSPPDLEVKRRIEELLNRIAAAGDYTPTEIMHGRAVEVLEAIATPEAHAVLTRWAAGHPGAVLTVAARQALGRLPQKIKDR